MIAMRPDYAMPMLGREHAPYQFQRRLFGWVISHEATALFEQLGQPTVSALPGAIGRFATSRTDSPLYDQESDELPYLSQGLDTLEQGISDVSHAVCLGLDSSHESLEALVRNQSPVLSGIIAGIAGLPTEELATYFHIQSRRLESDQLSFAAFTENAYAVVGEEDTDMRGCPFAKKTPSRDPLFDSFVNWATRLTIEAHDYVDTTAFDGFIAPAGLDLSTDF
jgi:hypothetical protein